MKIRERRNELLGDLKILLKPHEFNFVSRMDWFIRKGTTSLMYRLDFYGGKDRDSPYMVAPSLAIRIDRVEDIYHEISDFEPKYRKDTPTIWPTIKELQRAKDGFEYVLDSEEDVKRVVNELFRVFKEIALPFLERNSSIHAVDDLLNSTPENESNIFLPPPSRFLRGVIVAKLAGRENFEHVVETYRKHLSQYGGHHLEKYEQLLEILN